MGSHVSAKAERDATAVMVSLRRIVRFLRLADREAQEACGLSAAQLFVLHVLADAPGASLADLAGLTLTDPSSVSAVVERLVKRRLVRRARAADDARRAELHLTAAGTQVLRTAPRAPQVAISRKLRALPAVRRATMTRTLDELVVLMGADGLEPRMFGGDEPLRSSRRGRVR